MHLCSNSKVLRSKQNDSAVFIMLMAKVVVPLFEAGIYQTRMITPIIECFEHQKDQSSVVKELLRKGYLSVVKELLRKDQFHLLVKHSLLACLELHFQTSLYSGSKELRSKRNELAVFTEIMVRPIAPLEKIVRHQPQVSNFQIAHQQLVIAELPQIIHLVFTVEVQEVHVQKLHPLELLQTTHHLLAIEAIQAVLAYLKILTLCLRMNILIYNQVKILHPLLQVQVPVSLIHQQNRREKL